MKKNEKIAYLKDVNFDIFIKTWHEVEEELSKKQNSFCCCGKLATGLHEAHCKKFKDKVNSEVIKRLKHLLPSKR